MLRENAHDLLAFIAVARERSFTKAAAQLGVSQSSLSHPIKAFETRLGMRLLTRTTRSVSLTDAGDTLYQSMSPHFDAMEANFQTLLGLRDKPAGVIRITASDFSFHTVLWPVLADFLGLYPDINVEVICEYGLVDIVAERYDAGVRYGEKVADGMIAVRIAPDMRMTVVGSPLYFEHRNHPTSPSELFGQNCIGMSHDFQDIVLSEDEQIELSRRLRSATISQRDGRRARVILLAAQSCSRNEIAKLTGLSVVSVTRWCKRFQELRLQGLVDLPGRGRKSSLPAEALKRTLEQVTQPRIGQPRWSCRSMARVAGISPASVQRIWAANDIKPHLTRTFKLSNDPNFEEKFWDVIGLYLDPPDKALVLCCDEKSQVQALERTQPGLPLGIGHIRTQSHDYIRHGTVTLFTALDYLQGRLISCIERQHRHQEWLEFLKKINRETPKHLQLHLIVDNYATHKHPKVKAWLEKHKRFHMHFTPTSSSWMNMVERFFRDITVYLRDGSFSSVRELESSITTFLALRNAQPTRYVWNARGEDILNKIQRAREAVASKA